MLPEILLKKVFFISYKTFHEALTKKNEIGILVLLENK